MICLCSKNMELVEAEETEDKTTYIYQCKDENCNKKCKVTTFYNGLKATIKFLE